MGPISFPTYMIRSDRLSDQNVRTIQWTAVFYMNFVLTFSKFLTQNKKLGVGGGLQFGCPFLYYNGERSHSNPMLHDWLMLVACFSSIV